MIPENPFINDFVRFARYVSIWPIGNAPRWRIFLYKAVAFFHIGLLGYFSFSLLMELITEYDGDMGKIAVLIDFMTVLFSNTCRFMYVYRHGKTFASLSDTVNTAFFNESLNKVGPKMTLQAFQIKARRIIMINWVGTVIFAMGMVLRQIYSYICFDSGKGTIPSLFKGWHYFSEENEPIRSIVFIMKKYTWFLTGYSYIIFDSVVYMTIFTTIGQFKLICYTFRNMISNTNLSSPVDRRKNNSPVNSVIKYKNENYDNSQSASDFSLSKEDLILIKQCLHHHQVVRLFIQRLRDLLAPLVLIDFAHGILSMTFIAFGVVVNLQNKDWPGLVDMLVYGIVSVLHQFLYNYISNELVLEDAKIGEALYDFPWHLTSAELKPPLILTVAACRRSFKLHGIFFTMSNDYFVATMKLIFSYFMVVIQLHGGEKK